MSKHVTVVIANWNRLDYLRTCISAVLSQEYDSYQTFVVDNGSTDGSVTWIRSLHPKVRLICNDTNHGFARATNQGIQAQEGTYVATLNNDAWPEPGWLMEMVRAMEQDNRTGMVASQVTLAQHPDLLDSAGIEVDTLGTAWNRHFGMPVAREPEETQEVFGACAAAALYRRKMLDQIGLFDERYFAYLEDVELAWRAQRAGWRCMYAPKARALHLRSATGGQGGSFKAYHLSRNRIWTLVKHYPLSRFALWWPLILLAYTASWMWPLTKGQTGAVRGQIDALLHWRWAWQERRQRESWPYEVPLIRPRFRMPETPDT